MLLSKLALLVTCLATPFLIDAKRTTTVSDVLVAPNHTCTAVHTMAFRSLKFATSCDYDINIDYVVKLNMDKTFGIHSKFVNEPNSIRVNVLMDLVKFVEFNDITPEAYSPYVYKFDGSHNWSPITYTKATSAKGVGSYNFDTSFNHPSGWKLQMFGTFSEGYTIYENQQLLPAGIKYNLKLTNYPFKLDGSSLSMVFGVGSNEYRTLDTSNNALSFGDNVVSFQWVPYVSADGINVPITALYRAGTADPSLMATDDLDGDESYDQISFIIPTNAETILWDPIWGIGGGGGPPPIVTTTTTTASPTSTVTR